MTEQRAPSSDRVHPAATHTSSYQLHLFVAGRTPATQTAITNITLFCECRLTGRYKLAVTDVLEEPDLARADQICAVPALLRRYPLPMRMVIGDFANFDALAKFLDVTPIPVADHHGSAAADGVPTGKTSRSTTAHLNMGALIAPTITTPATVLIADDEECVRGLTAELLGLHGYNVLTASNGEEALATLQEHGGKVDLLVTDVVMPVMDGPEFAKRSRSLYPNVKVLFMSGYADRTIADQLAQFPDAQLVAKPFTLDALVRKVREVLGASHG